LNGSRFVLRGAKSDDAPEPQMIRLKSTAGAASHNSGEIRLLSLHTHKLRNADVVQVVPRKMAGQLIDIEADDAVVCSTWIEGINMLIDVAMDILKMSFNC
jgi:hypothetical protein